jgi:hypothetical protein
MSKVAPYHTTTEEYPPDHRNVYHDRDDCPDGKRIKAAHKKAGTNNKPRCKECAKLG